MIAVPKPVELAAGSLPRSWPKKLAPVFVGAVPDSTEKSAAVPRLIGASAASTGLAWKTSSMTVKATAEETLSTDRPADRRGALCRA